jgi:predicted DNA binding CopG/RHH family protein
VAEGTRERQTLLTVPMERGELRAVKVNAAARGLTMAEWVRQLLRDQLVDLLP